MNVACDCKGGTSLQKYSASVKRRKGGNVENQKEYIQETDGKGGKCREQKEQLTKSLKG